VTSTPTEDLAFVLERARAALHALDSSARSLRDRLGEAFEHLNAIDLNAFPVEVLHDVLALRHRLAWRQAHAAEEDIRATIMRMTDLEIGEAERLFRNLLARLERLGSRLPP